MIIFYDSECEICTQIKSILKSVDLDGKLQFSPISDQAIYEKYEGLNYWDARQTIHLIDDDGQIHSSEQAVIKIIEQIRLISKISPILSTKLGLQVTALAYKALNKYRLKRIKNCSECRP